MTWLFTFFVVSSAGLWAQYVPVPAPVQTRPVLLSGATAHLGNGQVIENSLVAFEGGKITVVADAKVKRAFPDHLVVDASGKHLYPGFIAPNTTLGLTEIDGVRATQDNSELGEMNPNIRSIVAYNTDSEITPTVRSMGVLMAEPTPKGGRISGTSSIVVLDAWNWEDAAYATDIAMHLNWPQTASFNWREQRMVRNESYDEQLAAMDAYFREAQSYCRGDAEQRGDNLRFEAMCPLFDGACRLLIHANNVQAIQEGVLFAEKFKLKPVIVGGNDSWMITDFLRSHEVPVILSSTQRLPSREDEDVDQPFKTPAQLQQAGVTWCFGHNGYWQQRNLPFQAGQAVPFGLAYEEAIQALTGTTAKIFGIDGTTGTLEVGKDATLFLSAGDVLDMRTSKVTQAFIQGREIDLNNKQEMLYNRFQQKYKQR
jgi:imidazolonepropionase-like amidohydrolase